MSGGSHRKRRRVTSSATHGSRPPRVARTPKKSVAKNRIRRQLLQDWRGLPEMEDRPDRTTLVASVLEKLLPKLGLGERLQEQQIEEAWKAIVGEFLSAHSSPVALRDGCLLVRVSQPTVRYELEQVWKSKIISSLQERFGKGKVRTLRFQL